MKLKVNASKAVIKVASKMASVSYGSASMFGFYQPNEPKQPVKKSEKWFRPNINGVDT